MTHAALPQPVRAFLWSVRREFWEHRLVLLAPAGVAVLVLLGCLAAMPFGLYRGLADPAHRQATIALMGNLACFLVIVAGFAAALFYCIEALQGERRDRSILFFKSLPVSDRVSVAAKLAIPVIVLPAIVFAAYAVLWPVILIALTVLFTAAGQPVAPLWAGGGFPVPLSCLAYMLAITALWYLPLYCALLAVSVVVKWAALLWVALPLALVDAVDRLAVHSGQVERFYLHRLFGWYDAALRLNDLGYPVGRLPGQFFAAPGLWLGLAAAGLLFAVAVRARRYATPL